MPAPACELLDEINSSRLLTENGSKQCTRSKKGGWDFPARSGRGQETQGGFEFEFNGSDRMGLCNGHDLYGTFLGNAR